MNGKVETVKIASADFAALAYKDPDVLYFVTNYGDFGPNNMADIKIYLGTRLIGIDSDSLGLLFQGLTIWDGSVVALDEALSKTNHYQDISLATFPDATIFELNLHATLHNPGQSPVNVEVWMERGYYEKVEKEGEVEFIWHTGEHIAATQVYIPSYSGHSLNATCCANIAGQLIGPYPSDPCQYVRVCFSATGPINICPATPQNNLPKATALTIRCWTPVLSA